MKTCSVGFIVLYCAYVFVDTSDTALCERFVLSSWCQLMLWMVECISKEYKSLQMADLVSFEVIYVKLICLESNGALKLSAITSGTICQFVDNNVTVINWTRIYSLLRDAQLHLHTDSSNGEAIIGTSGFKHGLASI